MEAPKSHTRSALFFILAFSLATGLAAIWQYRESPFFELPIIDEEAYVKWADEVAGGAIVGDKVYYQDPLYPYSLAFLFALFGKSLALVRVAQALLGTASVWLVYVAARRLMGERPALLAAGILALYGGMYFFELLLVKATLVLFVSAGSCALGVWAADRPRSWLAWLCLGVSLGLSVLLRGNFQAVIPLLLVWSFFAGSEESWKARLTRPLYLALGVIMVITPVTLRNYVVGGELVMTTSQGGANFFIGNNERANGRYVTLPFVRANPEWEATDFEDEAERLAERKLTPSEVSSFWFARSFDWMKANPGEAARLMFTKARLMVHHFEIPDNHSFYLTRDRFVGALWPPFVRLGYLWGPALVGMIVLCRRDRRALYPALFALLYAGSVVPFFIVARYRMPVVPALAIFSSAFLFWLIEDWKGGAGRVRAWSLVVVLAFLILGLYPTHASRAPMGAEYYLLGNAYLKTDRPEEAVEWYDRALALLPDHADAMRNRAEAMFRINPDEIGWIMKAAQNATPDELVDMGKRLEGLGQFKGAIVVYERATELDPGLFPPRARLGFLYATNAEIRNPDRAIMHLDRALQIDPQNVDTMNALGNVHFLAGNHDQAIQWYKQVLKIKPGHQGARQNLRNLGVDE